MMLKIKEYRAAILLIIKQKNWCRILYKIWDWSWKL